jgi:hypothetical protein
MSPFTFLFYCKGLTRLFLHQHLQQHINRGIRRLARMTGRQAPSSSSLEQNLVKRVQAVEGTEGLERRFNRQGVYRSLPRREVVLEKRYQSIGCPGTQTEYHQLFNQPERQKGSTCSPSCH